jgi:outer membrane protein assembly factor BamA
MQNRFLILILILAYAMTHNAYSQYIANEDEGDYFIRDIIIERDSVWMRSDKDWFFAAKLANKFHGLTREYIIQDELLFESNKMTIEDYLAETERNLRKTGLFTTAKIELDSVAEGTYDAYIVTKDRWSLYPKPLLGSGGGDWRAGVGIDEFNLFGTGTSVIGDLLYRNENNIGWQGELTVHQARLFRSEIGVTAYMKYNKYRTEQFLSFEKQYRTLETPSSYGISATNNYGDVFRYIGDSQYETMNTTERRLTAFYSHGWKRQNRYFATALLQLEDIDRPAPTDMRAFDNCGRFLVQFSSTFHQYAKIRNVYNYLEDDIESGGYGRVIIGQTFPMKPNSDITKQKGESIYYVGGEGEQSYYNGKFYVFVGIRGASGFQNGFAKFTYQGSDVKSFYQFSPLFTLGYNMRQQTVWNWHLGRHRDRQLILDAETGLRGYEANGLKGDNRIISSLEARFFPKLTLWVLDVSGVAFWDAGTVWQEGVDLVKTKWHHSAGLGLRLHFSKSANPSHTSRIDVAYNFDEGRVGSVMFTSKQYIDLYAKHDWRKPKLFGLEYDE